MVDLTIFILKYTFLGFIYIFLFWLLRLVAKDIRVGSSTALETKRTVTRANLVLEESPGLTKPRHIPVSDGLTIGRGSRNKIILEDDSVSHSHARIFVQDGFYMIEDTGSTNGTFVNNQIIAEPKPLEPGSSIKIGRSRFLFTEL